DVLSAMRHVGRGWARRRRTVPLSHDYIAGTGPSPAKTMPVRFDPAAIRSDFTRKSRTSRILWNRYRPGSQYGVCETGLESQNHQFFLRIHLEYVRMYLKDLFFIPKLDCPRIFFSFSPNTKSISLFQFKFQKYILQLQKTDLMPISETRIYEMSFSLRLIRRNLSCSEKRECGTRHDWQAAGSETVPAMRQEYERGKSFTVTVNRCLRALRFTLTNPQRKSTKSRRTAPAAQRYGEMQLLLADEQGSMSHRAGFEKRDFEDLGGYKLYWWPQKPDNTGPHFARLSL
ncbi:hypothetical protein ALC60_08698, partial [Trachymyrmex zeteki]